MKNPLDRRRLYRWHLAHARQCIEIEFPYVVCRFIDCTPKRRMDVIFMAAEDDRECVVSGQIAFLRTGRYISNRRDPNQM